MHVSKDDTMVKVVNGRRYSTETATLLADDEYWDGRNMDRDGRNHFLYRTQKGRYFTVTLTRWQRECHSLDLLENEDEARRLYESLACHYVSYEEAFPSFQVEEA